MPFFEPEGWSSRAASTKLLAGFKRKEQLILSRPGLFDPAAYPSHIRFPPDAGNPMLKDRSYTVHSLIDSAPDRGAVCAIKCVAVVRQVGSASFGIVCPSFSISPCGNGAPVLR